MKKLTDFGLTAQEAAQVVKGIANGQYHLLTGAGSSHSTPGGDGEPLTDGRTFAKQLCDEFKLPLVGNDRENLQLAHEEADAAEPERLKRWLKKRFTKCSPTWQSVLFRFAWNRIWTFNIDDVMERAFDPANGDNHFTEFESIDWKEPLQASADLATIQIIHLHGRAVDLQTKDEGLVFSVPEYGNAAKSFQHWHAAFQTHYIERPFIVCGASLSSEVDLSDAIRNKNEAKASTGFPSIALWHSADEPTKSRMRRYNLVPVVANANEFFLSLDAEVRSYRSKYQAGFDKLSSGTFEKFITQFRRMQVDGPRVPTSPDRTSTVATNLSGTTS